MRHRSLVNLLGCGLFLAVFSLGGSAQVRFVQITDPHLFDEGPQALDNRKALSACVKEINERVEAGVNYQFVVVTGDIGVEKIIEKLVPKEQNASPQERQNIENEIVKEIEKGVGVVSAILSSSKVHLWLFVPGNNDLYKENPATIEYYNHFTSQLAATLLPLGVEVRDLCPADNSKTPSVYAKSQAYVYGKYAFIGFNNASFKNNDDSSNLVPLAGQRGSTIAADLKRLQGEYVEQVKSFLSTPQIQGAEVSYAYIFYHIPEVDDPYLISGNEGSDAKLKGKLDERQKAISGNAVKSSHRYSSWFVHQDVRASWDDLLKNGGFGKLMGLFAGHLHDWKRETYQDYHWLKAYDYASASLSKLYICPPIAVKLQGEKPDQARGFMDVAIDQQGRILDEWGRNGAQISWYNPSTDSFGADENEKETEYLSQLALGHVYENAGRFIDAETAYHKALASKSAVTRENASSSIQRTAEKQVFPLNRYFFTPWGFSLSLEGSLLLIFASLLLMLALTLLAESRLDLSFSTIHLLPFTIGFVAFLLVLWLLGRYLHSVGLFISPSAAFLLTATAAIAAIWVLWSIMRRHGRNVLIVLPLTDSTEGKLGSTFAHILTKTRQMIIASREDRFYGTDIPITVLRLGEETQLADLAESAVPGGLGKIAAWLVRQATQPEFYVRGSLQSAGANLMMIVTLESAGRTLHTWFSRFATADLAATEEDFAYAVLTYTLAPELYDDAS